MGGKKLGRNKTKIIGHVQIKQDGNLSDIPLQSGKQLI